MITENLPTLKIHKFKTQQQYESAKERGLIGDNDFVLIPDEPQEDELTILYCGDATTNITE